MTQSKTHVWRQDITGLRSLAVLPVLFFHAFPNAIPGGFYGVDIFFVISGYLISGIIFRGLIKGNFSYANFYSKRIRRILPNLITLLFFVAIVGWFFMTAFEFTTLGKNIYSSAAFYQNFRLMSTNYFDISSEAKPLLHLWSLAIEEQFYIIFPIICVLIWKFSRRSVTTLGFFVAFVTIGSFILCLCVSNDTFRFYFPLTRFWELGTGICLSYAEIFLMFDSKRWTLEIRNVLSVLGLFLILFAMFFYQQEIKAPGLFTLLPIAGSILLIASNVNALINRTFLSWKWMCFIGLISYSLYLWHWPLISYLHIILPQAAQWYSWVALALAFLLSILVYCYIENPLRRSNSKANVVFLLSALVACFTLGQVIKKMDGFPERPIAKALTFDDDFAFMKVTKESKLLGQNIRLTDENQFPEILFVGDSHAQQYAARVKLLADHTHKSVAFLTSGGCFVANGQGGNPKECAHTPESLKILLQDARIKTVVIGQIWGAYMTQNLGVDFVEGVNSYVEIMKKFGQSKKFYVLLDAPWDQGSYNITNHLNRLNYKAALEVEHYWVSYPMDDSWLKGNRYVQDAFSSLSTLIVTDNLVCPNKKCDLKNYMDDDHLRSSYIEKNAYWIDQVFQ